MDREANALKKHLALKAKKKKNTKKLTITPAIHLGHTVANVETAAHQPGRHSRTKL
jgi:hypothetical protein